MIIDSDGFGLNLIAGSRPQKLLNEKEMLLLVPFLLWSSHLNSSLDVSVTDPTFSHYFPD